MRRVVFLDFDGVVMTEATYRAAGVTPRDLPADERVIEHTVRKLDPVLVGHLNTLCRLADADVVLSTSWRPSEWAPDCSSAVALGRAGLTAPVVGSTPRVVPGQRFSEHVERGRQITAWLDEHRPGWTPADFVILDDDSDIGFPERWVQSDFVDGFTATHLAQALALFGVAP